MRICELILSLAALHQQILPNDLYDPSATFVIARAELRGHKARAAKQNLDCIYQALQRAHIRVSFPLTPTKSPFGSKSSLDDLEWYLVRPQDALRALRVIHRRCRHPYYVYVPSYHVARLAKKGAKQGSALVSASGGEAVSTHETRNQ